MRAIAVVGLGAMGSRIAQRLLSAGHEIIVWNRTPAKLAQIIDLGATAAGSPADAARRAEVLITMVSDPAALRAVSEGDESIAAGADATLTVIEMSTVGPAGVARLASVLPAGTPLLDAPVLGSLGKAEAGSLTIFVGGPVALVEQAEPLLSSLGSVLHVGPLGAGQAAKLVANATLFSTLATLGEAIALAHALGLSKSTVYELLAATPLAGQAQRRRDAIERGDYPSRFPLALARKDAELIAEAAAAAGVDLRLIKAARTWLADAEAAGSGDRDYTALLATDPRQPERRRGRRIDDHRDLQAEACLRRDDRRPRRRHLARRPPDRRCGRRDREAARTRNSRAVPDERPAEFARRACGPTRGARHPCDGR
jgi:3-hydroxyisobutyrate dehydrogenase/2-hydroxy-3-oxopropionate reductase